MEKVRLLRITTVPISLTTLLRGQLTFLAQQNFEVLAVSSAGVEVEQVKAEGIHHVAVAMTRKITPFQDLVALWKLIRLIQKFKPDIIHTHTPKAGLLGLLAAWLCRVPVRMHTIAGLVWIESTGFKRWFLKKMEWLTYACATAVYPNSNEMRQMVFRELHFNPMKMKVIGSGSSNGIDTQFFSPKTLPDSDAQSVRARFKIEPGAIVFCFVGRMVRDKGMVELVDAFEQLQHSNKWLLLVGHMEADLDPLPVGTLQKIEANNRIIEAGFQTDVRPWLAASNVFVFPSYREGFPNVVMQAACMELPCIVSNINGCNEIIQHNHTGLVIPAKDTDALAEAMRAMIQLPDGGQRMGQAARTFVAAHFDQQVVWRELLREYNATMKYHR